MAMPLAPLRRGRLAALAVLSALAAVPAQRRAPCTGAVRDVDGTPLAGAEIVCAWRPNAAFGAADRRTTTADANGRFAVDLAVGTAYWIWAIGRADATGQRSVVVPTLCAAGGAVVDLRTGLRMVPVKLTVTGSAPWIAAGPLALRIGIAENVALGPDVPLPGDGAIALPPLPTDRLWVALVDGAGGVLDKQFVDVSQPASIAFPPLREFDARVGNDRGDALAGVPLVQLGYVPLPAAGAAGGFGVERRVVATTDRGGSAHCRVPDARSLLVAELPGHLCAMSGWSDGVRCENGQAAADDADRPLSFVLVPQRSARLRLLGAGTADAAAVRFEAPLIVRVAGRMRVHLDAFAAQPEADGEFACPVAVAGACPTAFVRVDRDQDVPRLTFATLPVPGPEPAELDLGTLHTFAVQVVDAAGSPVPCVTLGLTRAAGGDDTAVVELVTDRDGRAELSITPDGDTRNPANRGWALRAADATCAGTGLLRAGDPGPVRIQLQPMTVMRLRVVDSDGHPVVGARVEWGGADGPRHGPGPGDSLQAFELACMAVDAAAQARLEPLRTDPTGSVEIPFLDPGFRIDVVVSRGDRRSDKIALRASDEPVVVTLP